MKAQDLKNSILQLAVQGKLVEQDPNDEPASVLLERIREERAQLIKEKKIKKPKGGESVICRGSDGSHYEKRDNGEPVCIDDEIPFEIPETWEWARLESVLSLSSGLGYKKGDLAVTSDRMIRVLRGGNINLNDKVDIKDNDVLISAEFVDDDLLLCPGQIITPAVTSLENVGKAALIAEDMPDTVCGGFVFFLTPYILDASFSAYLHCWMTAPSHRQFCKDSVKKSGQAFYNLSKASLNSALIALPPLAEQRRIVAKVDELMPLVEKYGELEDAREALDAALPDRLRKSVLQLAVEGKLVPQDPSDEPANELLERIRAERAELVKQKKIRKPKGGEPVIYREGGSWYERRGKSEPACIDDEIPFDIPESWEWARLETVTSYIQRGKSPRYSNIEKYPVVAQKCNQWSGFSLKLAKFIDPDTVASYAEERILRDGDLLWNSTGIGTLGRMAVYDSRVNKYGWAVADSHVTVIRTKESWLDFRFAYLYFAGPSVQLRIEDQASGSTKQKELAQETVRNYLIPIPPHEEQLRIVEKANTLLELIGTEESWMTR